MTIALACLAVLGTGLLVGRSAPASARWLTWCIGICFVIVALPLPQVEFTSTAAATTTVELPVVTSAARERLLVAAAQSGPRAVDLAVRWAAPLPAIVTRGPLGAVAAAPTPLPFAPDAVLVRCLGEAAVGRPLRVEVELPTAIAELVVELVCTPDGGEPHRVAVTVRDGVGEASLLPAVPGRHQLVLSATVAGHTLRGEGAFVVGAPPPVLVLEPSGTLAAALAAQGVAVERAAALPADFASRAALVLGMPLDAAQQTAVVTAVEDGLGLFVVAPGFGRDGEPLRGLLPLTLLPTAERGGERAAAGGAGAVDPLAPPSTPPPPDEAPPPAGDTTAAGPLSQQPIDVDKHTIAMVLVVDRSGSMGQRLGSGETKMSFAKTSALHTAMALGEGDLVGLVTFGNKDAGRVELQLTPATDLVTVRAGIEKLRAAQEFTYLLSGLRAARAQLQAVRAAVKHVVVISDGEFDLGEEVALGSVANVMRKDDHITVSVISIIDGQSDPQFEGIAARIAGDGGGQFFAARDVSHVPALVSGEVTRALQSAGRKPKAGTGGEPLARPAEPAPRHEAPPPAPPAASPPPAEAPIPPRHPVVATEPESPLLQPLPPLAWPALGGVRANEARLEAMVLLAVADAAGYPVLAFANRGLGRVAAFAADLAGDDGVDFRRDPEFPARLTRWLGSVLPALPLAQTAPGLRGVVVQPPAPTPADLGQLAALAGAAPVAPEALPAATVQTQRVVRSAVAERAGWLGWLLLLLAAGERAAAAWAQRRRLA
ncbi:MAG: VWA domain-containing protein [Planctomycetes bacterium]|nr:VWA domain-containing protein [Planctomycetota bacterium]